MQLFTFSLATLSILASASAAPALLSRAGPSGTLVVPAGGTNWDNTGGFGLGHVVYQGVDEDYSNPQGVTHVTTHHIDIYLEAQDGSGTTYYLAKGIAPKDLVVDEEFQVPIGYDGPTGSYRLIIEETQEGQTPGFPLPDHLPICSPIDHLLRWTNSLNS